MRIRFLGTAASEGWPALFCSCEPCLQAARLGGKNIRTRAQALVDDTLLIDFGPDTYMHMLCHDVPLRQVTDVLVTHSHQDHWYPDDLMYRCAPYAHGIEGKLHIWGNSSVTAQYEDRLNRINEHGVRQHIVCHTVAPFQPFALSEGYLVTPLLARHNPAESCLIYLIEKDGKTILYAHDTGYFPEESFDYLAQVKLDLISFDCTHVLGGDGDGHMGIPAVEKVRERLIGQGSCHMGTRYVLNHFSHNGRLLHEEIEAVAAPKGLITAWDGMSLRL